MKLAAIDIGSNGARMQLSSVLLDEGRTLFKKIEYVRFPLRLGHDGFTEGSISAVSEDRMVKLMLAYQLLMELHEVDDYLALATSAMREAANGTQVRDRIEGRTGIQIQIIDGQREAELVNNVVVQSLGPGQYLHIDVGGGSTELNLYQDGVKVKARSFRLGAVRLLEGKEEHNAWEQVQQWIEESVNYRQPIEAVGTGGNINKLFDLASKLTLKSAQVAEIQRVRDYVAGFDLQERIHKLQLNPDRADVIVPAADIYLSAMKWAGAEVVNVPDLGLKDGIIKLLHEQAIRRQKS